MKREREEMEHPSEPPLSPVSETTGAQGSWLRRKRKDLLVSFVFLLLAGALVGAGHDAYLWFRKSPPYVDPVRYPIRGIDVSSHNGFMNLEAAREEGIDFVFIKASEGGDFRDPNFRLNYAKARHAGMKIGAYHFFRFDVDGISQARNLIDAVGGRRLDLGLAVDVEKAGNARGVPLDSILDRLGRMSEYLSLCGYRPIFYSNLNGYFDYLEKSVPGMPLWICSFNQIPIERDWVFWQFNHHGQVAGIKGDVDLDVFYGSEEEWGQFIEDQHYPAGDDNSET